MTISDLHCDTCGDFIPGPTGGSGAHGGGVRFVYHPGRPQLRDTSGLMCASCWDHLGQWLGSSRHPLRCAVCQAPVTRSKSLHLHRFDDALTWRLCARHAVEFLNRLSTVQPKLELANFRFPFDDDAA